MESAFLKRRVMESFSHAWSAHPLYHLMEILGGVRQTGLAWKTISFAPTSRSVSAVAAGFWRGMRGGCDSASMADTLLDVVQNRNNV